MMPKGLDLAFFAVDHYDSLAAERDPSGRRQVRDDASNKACGKSC